MALLIQKFPGDRQAAFDRGFLSWVVVLTLACLWPIWWYRFLPMQDYPQHLFIAQVLSTFDAPGFDWQQNYELNSSWGAYTLTYGLMRLFLLLTNIENAGKLLTSLYVLLMAVVVLRAARYCSAAHSPPWPLLLIFPFVFNQTYFLGFQSYLLSIPLLFLALIDLGDSASRPITLSSLLRQFGVVLLLFLAHPFSVLTYLTLGLLLAVFNFPDRATLRKTVVPLVLVAMVFIVWYFASSLQANVIKPVWAVQWASAEGVAVFYLVMFTGMRWIDGANFYAVALWGSVFGLLIFFAARNWRHVRVSMPAAAFLVLTLLGFIILPFWMGYYSYFNLRLAPVSYILLVWLLAGVCLSRTLGHIIGALALALVAVSVDLHEKISAETEELLPVLAKMEKNAAVLPVIIDRGSKVIDSEIFYEIHSQDHYYYHLLVGGGVNPLAFPNPMLPVHLRQDRQWPTAKSLDKLPPHQWQEVLSRYRYILVRTNNAGLILQWSQFANMVVRSESWALFEARNTMAPAMLGASP